MKCFNAACDAPKKRSFSSLKYEHSLQHGWAGSTHHGPPFHSSITHHRPPVNNAGLLFPEYASNLLPQDLCMASQPFLCPRGFSPKHLQDLSPLSPGFIFGALVPTASCSDTCQHYSYFLGFKIQSFSCWLVGWFFVYLTCAWFFCLVFFFFVFFFVFFLAWKPNLSLFLACTLIFLKRVKEV